MPSTPGYKRDYKKSDIDKELLLDNKSVNSKLYKFSKLSVKIGIFIYYFIALLMFSSHVQDLFEPWTSGFEIMMIIISISLLFALATYTLKMHKYIGSFNTKKILTQIGIAFLPLILFMGMFMGIGTIGSIFGNIDFIISIFIFLISSLLFLTALKLKKINIYEYRKILF